MQLAATLRLQVFEVVASSPSSPSLKTVGWIFQPFTSYGEKISKQSKLSRAGGTWAGSCFSAWSPPPQAKKTLYMPFIDHPTFSLEEHCFLRQAAMLGVPAVGTVAELRLLVLDVRLRLESASYFSPFFLALNGSATFDLWMVAGDVG